MKNRICLKALFVLLWAMNAHAQEGMRPGVVEQYRQEERIEAIRKRQEQIPDMHLPSPALQEAGQIPSDESPCFVIDRIRFVGEDIAFFKKFQDELNDKKAEDSPIGRCIGSQGVVILYKRIQNRLIARGYITTRIGLSRQDLSMGEIVFSLIPGRLRSVVFESNVAQGGRLATALPFAKGDVLNLRDIEQALENLERVPSARADIQIAPGDLPGESDLRVLYEQSRSLRGSLSLDNSGMKTTGRYQGGVSLFWDNPGRLNDTFYLTFNRNLDHWESKAGSWSSVVHYSVPMDYWTFSLTRSESRSDQIVAGAFVDYHYRSWQRDAEVSVRRILHRDRNGKSSFRLSGFQRVYKNYIDDTEVRVQRRVAGGWEAELEHQQSLGNTAVSGHIGYKRGTGAFHALSAPEEAFGEGSARFGIVRAGLALDTPFEFLGREFRYHGDWRVRWNRTPLSSPDRFMIGGRYTVRGFDGEVVLSAERGWLVRNEVSMALKQGAAGYVGVDYGQVGGATSKWLVGRRLAGAALGVRGMAGGLGYDFSVGAPLYKPKDFKASGAVVDFVLSYGF